MAQENLTDLPNPEEPLNSIINMVQAKRASHIQQKDHRTLEGFEGFGTMHTSTKITSA